MDKVKQIKDFLKDHVLELDGYLESDDYDDLEKHDIKVAIEECMYIYDVIEGIEKEAKTI